jgi:uncharacterized protein YjbI with pentapeptide repeats
MAAVTEPIQKETKDKKVVSRRSTYDEIAFKSLAEKSPDEGPTSKAGVPPEKLTQAQFLNIINLTQASSAPLHLVFCDLTEVNLVGVNFGRADLRTSILKGSRLPKFCFDRAILSGADLSNCYLPGSSFKGASLFKCNLSGSVLSKALLCEANLVQADLTDVDLVDADVTLAKFAGTSSYADIN